MNEFIASQIKRLTARADVLAHRLATGSESWDDYQRGVGRYREIIRFRNEFQAMLKAAREPEQMDANDLDLTADDDNDVPPEPRQKPTIRTRARGWGGGG